jgi:hypothetical protein
MEMHPDLLAWFHVADEAKGAISQIVNVTGVYIEYVGNPLRRVVLHHENRSGSHTVELNGEEVWCADVKYNAHKHEPGLPALEIRIEYLDGQHRLLEMDGMDFWYDTYYSPGYH